MKKKEAHWTGKSSISQVKAEWDQVHSHKD